jgi:hypothetical protein
LFDLGAQRLMAGGQRGHLPLRLSSLALQLNYQGE